MKLLKYTMLSFILFLLGLVENKCLAKEWKGITPLHSTREDVEKTLRVKSSGNMFDVFKFDAEKVMILYSVSPCKSSYDKWKVAVGTVLDLIVIPDKPLYSSDVKIDASKFKKSFSSGTDVGVAIYTDEDDGYAIEFAYGRVSNYRYSPSKKDDKLLCSIK